MTVFLPKEPAGGTTEPSLKAESVSEAEAQVLLENGDFDGTLAWMMEEYGDRVFGYCVGMVRDRELAEDLLQTTFVNAHRSLPTYRGSATLKTWLFGIARHRCLDAVRQRQRTRQRFSQFDEASSGESFVDESRPEGGSVLADVLQFCLEKLQPELRELILQRFGNGLRYDEIEQLSEGLKAPALRARVSRTLPKLRNCLMEQGAFPL